MVLAGTEILVDLELIDNILNATRRQAGEVIVKSYISRAGQHPDEWPETRVRAMACECSTSLYTLFVMTHPPPGALVAADLILRWDTTNLRWDIAEPRHR